MDDILKQTQDQIKKNITASFNKGRGKPVPVGTMNAYKEMKMPDGTWKYVGDQGRNHPGVKHLFEGGAQVVGETENVKKVETSSKGFNETKDREEYQTLLRTIQRVQERQDLAVKKVHEQQRKVFNKESNSQWFLGEYKRNLQKIVNERDKFQKNLDKIKNGYSYVKKVLQQQGVTGATWGSTAIRGYNTLRDSGYEFSPYGEPRLTFYGVGNNRIDAIVSSLKELGFKNVSRSELSKTMGAGMTADIKWDPIYTSEQLTTEPSKQEEVKIEPVEHVQLPESKNLGEALKKFSEIRGANTKGVMPIELAPNKATIKVSGPKEEVEKLRNFGYRVEPTGDGNFWVDLAGNIKQEQKIETVSTNTPEESKNDIELLSNFKGGTISLALRGALNRKYEGTRPVRGFQDKFGQNIRVYGAEGEYLVVKQSVSPNFTLIKEQDHV